MCFRSLKLVSVTINTNMIKMVPNAWRVVPWY